MLSLGLCVQSSVPAINVVKLCCKSSNKVLVINYTYNLLYMNAIHQKILCSQRHLYQYIQRNTKSFPTTQVYIYRWLKTK